AQADNLHLDVWYKGENLLFDGGSYKYNTDAKTLKYFMGTESHNTVMLDDHDQMLKGSRFIWYNWSQSLSASTLDNENDFTFTGEISAFTFLSPKISHKRFIRKEKGNARWVVEDSIVNKPNGLMMKQFWHLLPQVKIVSTNLFNEPITMISESGLRSDYYGVKEPADQVVASTIDNYTKTTIELR